ncbi:hypothetical protein QJS66_14925 [Kocuria rhizophila]|nr:hypothetical protein QJS66_14925 [Kocuria rhizophila]
MPSSAHDPAGEAGNRTEHHRGCLPAAERHGTPPGRDHLRREQHGADAGDAARPGHRPHGRGPPTNGAAANGAQTLRRTLHRERRGTRRRHRHHRNRQ